PDPNTSRIDIRTRLQIFASGKDVSVFSRSTCAGVIGELKRLAVANAQPVIDRKHDEAAARQILIRAIVVCVLPPIVPAQQHLTRPATMDVDNRWFPTFSTNSAGWLEELSMRLHAVACAKRHELWSDELFSRKICRQTLGAQWTRGSARYRHHRRCWRLLGPGRQICHVLPVGGDHRAPLHTGAACERNGRSCIDRDFKQMTAI